MAHHKNTPQSVLDAPDRTFVWSARHAGATRSERRHGVVNPGLDAKGFARYLHVLRAAGANRTLVRTAVRRGKKVRRGGSR